MRARGCNPHGSRSSARFVIIIICGGTRRPKNSVRAGDISRLRSTFLFINYSTHRWGKIAEKCSIRRFLPDGPRRLRKKFFVESRRTRSSPRLGSEAFLTSFLSLSLSLSLSWILFRHEGCDVNADAFPPICSRSFSQFLSKDEGRRREGGKREKERQRMKRRRSSAHRRAYVKQ